MGLAKKGTRIISVDNHVYRWVVSPDDGYMVLVVELTQDPGQRLEAFFHYHDVYAEEESRVRHLVGQRRVISPAVVRTVIQAALGRGWQPAVVGLQPFRVLDTEQIVHLPEAGT